MRQGEGIATVLLRGFEPLFWGALLFFLLEALPFFFFPCIHITHGKSEREAGRPVVCALCIIDGFLARGYS